MNGSAAEHQFTIASSLGEALELTARGRRPIAGGTDLMVLFEAGRLPYSELVGIRRIPELRGIEVTRESVAIGAAATYSEIREHHLLRDEFPLLSRAASWTGGIANQNRGTIGGNIVNASPAADTPPALLIYGAELEITSLSGSRWVPYHSFHKGYKMMDLRPGELLTRVRCPRRVDSKVVRLEWSRKVGARKSQAISKVAIAGAAALDGGRLAEVRIAYASVAPVPLRCYRTEEALTGAFLTAGTRRRASEALAGELAPIDDIRSTAEYRRQVALNLLQEFLDQIEPGARLDEWNRLEPDEAARQIRACCGSGKWSAQMASKRPFANPDQVFSIAREIWNDLATSDRMEAFRAHPRIGESDSGPGSWSTVEQSAMQTAGERLTRQMAALNREYEKKFGFVFLIRAAGRSAQEMLDLLELRLANSRETELAIAAGQQAEITEIRLQKFLGAIP